MGHPHLFSEKNDGKERWDIHIFSRRCRKCSRRDVKVVGVPDFPKSCGCPGLLCDGDSDDHSLAIYRLGGNSRPLLRGAIRLVLQEGQVVPGAGLEPAQPCG